MVTSKLAKTMMMNFLSARRVSRSARKGRGRIFGGGRLFRSRPLPASDRPHDAQKRRRVENVDQVNVGVGRIAAASIANADFIEVNKTDTILKSALLTISKPIYISSVKVPCQHYKAYLMLYPSMGL